MREATAIDIFPGAFHLPEFLSRDDQRALVATVTRCASGPASFYRPRVRGGGAMRCELLCLGRHWNAMTYSYERTRSDYDDQPVSEIPRELSRLAIRAATEVGFTVRPDICLIIRYGTGGKMGLHQDKDEDASALTKGIPIVSLSVGDTARFAVGGFKRREPIKALELRSGDGFVMGGPSRLRYHGVTRILSGTGPCELGLDGRLNLTFRQYEA